MKVGFTVPDFKKGGYVAAVAAMMEGSKYSLTLPDLEDWRLISDLIEIRTFILSKYIFIKFIQPQIMSFNGRDQILSNKYKKIKKSNLKNSVKFL